MDDLNLLHLLAERDRTLDEVIADDPEIVRGTAKYDQNSTLLHKAAEFGHPRQLEQAELLIAHGAAVDADNDFLWSPLHMAARYGRLEMVRLLLDHGADPNKPSKPDVFTAAEGELGWTPLETAAVFGHHEVVDLLVAHGGDESVVEEWLDAMELGGSKSVRDAKDEKTEG